MVWLQKYNFQTFTWIFGIHVCSIIKKNKHFWLQKYICWTLTWIFGIYVCSIIKENNWFWLQKYNFWNFTWIFRLLVCCVIKENKWFGVKSTIFRLLPGYLEYKCVVLLRKTSGLASKVPFLDFYLDIWIISLLCD